MHYTLDWGWLRIGPPYIYLNIDPVIFHLGPLAVRWYGLMYVVGIMVALWAIKGFTERQGITQDLVYRVLWWCIAAGLIGGRLYFVIQQPNLVSYYLAQPWHIIATWEGGMAFYGAIFLVIPTLIWRSYRERINPLVMVDAGVLFASVGQIIGRVGNIINGDIIGYVSPSTPWATVYQNPNSFACGVPTTCNTPVQPAAGYEMLMNAVLIAVLFFMAKRVRRPGVLTFVYLFGYAITQFLVFFTRANDVVSFFGLWGNLGLKQAQWTSLVVFILLIPVAFFVLRRSKPVPAGANPLTYGIRQKPKEEKKGELATRILNGQIVQVVDGEIVKIEEVKPEDVRTKPTPKKATASTRTEPVKTRPIEVEDTRPTSEPEKTKVEPAEPEKAASAEPLAAESTQPEVTPIEDVPTLSVETTQPKNQSETAHPESHPEAELTETAPTLPMGAAPAQSENQPEVDFTEAILVQPAETAQSENLPESEASEPVSTLPVETPESQSEVAPTVDAPTLSVENAQPETQSETEATEPASTLPTNTEQVEDNPTEVVPTEDTPEEETPKTNGHISQVSKPEKTRTSSSKRKPKKPQAKRK